MTKIKSSGWWLIYTKNINDPRIERLVFIIEEGIHKSVFSTYSQTLSKAFDKSKKLAEKTNF